MSAYADLVPQYQRLRRLSRQMNNALLKEIPKDVMDEAGRKLGILRRGVMVFDCEEDMALLADACLHDIRRQGRTVVEHVHAEAPYPPGSDEMRLLAALKDAYYSVFVIEAAEPGVGIQVRDALGDETRFIMDMGFGSTARPGMALAGRVFVVDGITMTTGATIPMGTPPAAELKRKLRRFFKGTADSPAELTSREARSAFALRLVRDLRETEATSNVSYIDPGTPGQGRAPAVGRAWRAGRNDPCPCGSGRQFKNCCGASR